MVTMKIKIKYMSIAVVGVVIGILSVTTVISVATNPLRKSETDIQLWLQNKTPLGMPFFKVLREIEAAGWFDPNMQGSDGNTPEMIEIAVNYFDDADFLTDEEIEKILGLNAAKLLNL